MPGSPRRNARYTPLAADGPLPWDMIRAVPAIRRDVLAFLQATVARHGDVVAFPMPGRAVLLVNDPGGVRRVLQDNHRAYGKATVQYTSLCLVTGSGLLTSDGEVWREHRRTVQPAFHHGRLSAIAEQAVAGADLLRQAWDDAAPGASVDADAACNSAMLDVVGRTLFGTDLADVGEQVVHAVDVALRAVIADAQLPLPAWVPTPGRHRLAGALRTLDRVSSRIVAGRRAGDLGADDAGAGADLLALLLAAAGEGALTDREVRDEIVTMVIAGHETVASSLTWTLHLLAGEPDVQRRLHVELDAVLAGRRPRWEDLAGLRYTRAVVEEALRLFPPAWVITRRAVADDEICGVAVPVGTLVILSPWLLHRRAQSWPEPLAFRPERFLEAERATGRGDYVPFGAGPRLCIGRDVALAEATLVLATLLRDRTVRAPLDARPPQVEALVTLRPRGGLPLLLVPRG